MADEEQQQREPAAGGQHWDRELVQKLAFQALREQRRSRRWGIFFKLLFFGYLVVILYLAIPTEVQVGPHSALVDVTGVIAEDERASADNLVPALRAAFEHRRSRGVIIRANSPGGSPVQA